MVEVTGSEMIAELGTDLEDANQRFIAALGQITPANDDDAVGIGFTDEDIPLYHPVGSDDSYVLSEAFFNNDKPNMTKFEQLLIAAIETQVIPTRPLLAMAQVIASWEPLDRFYYGPLLLAMLRITQRATS